MKKRTLYLVSGPAGIGKSTIGQALARTFTKSAYVSGDALNDFHINGRELPWESEKERSLIWKNILCVSLNFLEVSDVVVDYVAFMSDARYLKKHLPNEVTMKYIVLDASLETLKQRDRMRPPKHQMKARVPILKREFDDDRGNASFKLYTGDFARMDLDAILRTMKSEDRYVFTETP